MRPDWFSCEPWALTEEELDLPTLGRTESLYTLANGHIGLRGNLDEGEPRAVSGTYLNGFYESYPMAYGERGFGFAEDGQSVVPVADGKVIRLLVEDEPFDVERGTLLHHRRTLDLRAGVLRRECHWRTAAGHEVLVRSIRLVSFVKRSVAAIRYEVEAIGHPVRIAVQSNLAAEAPPEEERDDPRAGRNHAPLVCELHVASGRRVLLAHRTQRSGLRVAAGMDHVVHEEGHVVAGGTHVEEDLGRFTVSTELEPGRVLRLDKFLSYHWSSRQTSRFLRDQVDASLSSAVSEGFDGLADEQREFLAAFWADADIELDGDVRIQQALRMALFHLLQASARAEGRAVASKGLTGPGYDGHAFWDTESFVLPAMTYLRPNVVRDALEWRWTTLEQARARAREFGLRGAMFPWRTIHGEECSGYWPAGTAALHVNADIADAARRYVAATGDEEFERRIGAELLVETARLWCSFGRLDPAGRFRIDGVTGPDEYSALVDNNVFTNLMAQQNLRAAVDVCARHPDRAAGLDVDEDEIGRWREAAERMYVPYDEARGLHPQDQDFLTHEPWNFEATPPECYPLMLHYPYLDLYRKQVIKQADLVLALHLRGDHFTDEQKRRNFDYYDQLTVRDSSLSACTQAIVAAEVGHLDLAWHYLREASLMDIEDLGRNTSDGLHIASLAGAVNAAIAGLGGMRDHGGELAFSPRLPPAVTRLRFHLRWRASRLRVDVGHGEASYVVLEGPPLALTHFGEPLEVDGTTVVRSIAPIAETTPPRQPLHRAPEGRASRH